MYVRREAIKIRNGVSKNLNAWIKWGGIDFSVRVTSVYCNVLRHIFLEVSPKASRGIAFNSSVMLSKSWIFFKVLYKHGRYKKCVLNLA